MQFERLRNSHKKQIIIGALVVCVVGGTLTFATSRAKYRINDSIDLAKGTINYKAYDFKIMAMYKSDDKTNYIEIEEMPSEGYTINESKSYCNMSNGSKDETAILKTIDGNHIISKLKKNDRCYLYFDKKITASETILANVTVNEDTPDFSQVATEDEGVYITDDPMYGTNAKTYYWRGAVENNYVKFANFCWRIVRINGDGTIRMIYDGASCHANGVNKESIAKTNIQYNLDHSQSYYVGWTYSSLQRPSTINPQTGGTASNVKNELESWYSSSIVGDNANKVTQGKYCNDRNTGAKNSAASGTWSTTWSENGTSFAYAGVDRFYNKHQPTLSCPTGDIYQLMAGLITEDEVEFAGVTNANNTSYYLYNGQYYWTMSPATWASNGITSLSANVFCVTSGGYRAYSRVTESIGLRPVINLNSNITFSGDGTLNNPYIVAN